MQMHRWRFLSKWIPLDVLLHTSWLFSDYSVSKLNLIDSKNCSRKACLGERCEDGEASRWMHEAAARIEVNIAFVTSKINEHRPCEMRLPQKISRKMQGFGDWWMVLVAKKTWTLGITRPAPCLALFGRTASPQGPRGWCTEVAPARSGRGGKQDQLRPVFCLTKKERINWSTQGLIHWLQLSGFDGGCILQSMSGWPRSGRAIGGLPCPKQWDLRGGFEMRLVRDERYGRPRFFAKKRHWKMITLTFYDKNQVLKSWSHTQTQYGIGAFFNYLWLPTFSGCFFQKKTTRHCVGADMGLNWVQHPCNIIWPCIYWWARTVRRIRMMPWSGCAVLQNKDMLRPRTIWE